MSVEFFKPTFRIDFNKFWKMGIAISVIACLFAASTIIYRLYISKDFNWGTDFSGGTELQVQFKTDTDVGIVRSHLAKGGFPNAQVVNFGDVADHEVLIRIAEVSEKGNNLAQDIVGVLTKEFGEGSLSLRRVDEVGPKVGRELKINAFLSLILASFGILVYVWFRFTPEFAPGGVIALFHDVLISAGVYVFLNHEFDLPIVAALLTIVGYSINDTMVIYDRIRDNMIKRRTGSLAEVVNDSVNETLSRTILTSFLTMLVVVALFIESYGGIRDFALVLFVGIITGTWSTIFVATPSVIWLSERKKRVEEKRTSARSALAAR